MPEVADLLFCSKRVVEEYARTGRLPGAKFGDKWIFPSSLLIEAVTTICRQETENRTKPHKPLGLQITPAESKRRSLPGLNLMPDAVVQSILEGR
jgi:hypothetical protein